MQPLQGFLLRFSNRAQIIFNFRDFPSSVGISVYLVDILDLRYLEKNTDVSQKGTILNKTSYLYFLQSSKERNDAQVSSESLSIMLMSVFSRQIKDFQEVGMENAFLQIYSIEVL